MRLLLYLSALLLSLHSCNIVNPTEEIPGYVVVEDYAVSMQNGEGTSSSNLREMWIYANDYIQGVYSTPTKVPVLQTGNTRITCYPGIWNNGIGTLRIRYPFLAAFDTAVNLQPNTEVKIQPHFSYLANLDIDATRNFDNSLGFNGTGNNSGLITHVTDPEFVFEGNGSALITLGEGQDYFLFSDANNFTFTTGNTVFLEMNYSCTNSFNVGCFITDGPNSTKVPVLTLTPTTSDASETQVWNKIYLDIGALGLVAPGADHFRIYFEGARNESNQPKVYLDNLKLVKFEE
jgi:hypothetical protein